MGKDLPGATVVKREENNEVGKKLKEAKKASKFSEFIETMRKKEEESVQPISSDYEVMSIDVKTREGSKLIMDLQRDKRLVGWNPKTGTALVLKLAFLEKKSKLKK